MSKRIQLIVFNILAPTDNPAPEVQRLKKKHLQIACCYVPFAELKEEPEGKKSDVPDG